MRTFKTRQLLRQHHREVTVWRFQNRASVQAVRADKLLSWETPGKAAGSAAARDRERPWPRPGPAGVLPAASSPSGSPRAREGTALTAAASGQTSQ